MHAKEHVICTLQTQKWDIWHNYSGDLTPEGTMPEQGMGRWVMGHGSNGSRKSDGSHGSWVTGC